MKQIREVAGIVFGGIATLVVALTVIGIVLAGKLLVSGIKVLCLPLVVLASLVYPDERNLKLHQRVVADIKEWWRTMQPAL